MTVWHVVGGALAGMAIGALLAGVVQRSDDADPSGRQDGRLAAQRGAALGPDDARIGGIRVTLETGSVNGAGTHRPVLLWLDNEEHELGDGRPSEAFAAGARHTTILSGPGLPRTLGALRQSSLVLALSLGDAAIGASWYCERALVEVRLEGEASFSPYLDRSQIAWLSMGEPPRRSPLFALQ